MLKMILILLIALVTLLAALWITTVVVFDGTNHSEFDTPRHAPTGTRVSESVEHKAAAKMIADGLAEPPQLDRKEMLHMMRKQMDDRGGAAQIGALVHATDANGVAAEWVIAANASPSRRLLFIHGGAYMIGSPQSHRPITSRLSELSGSAVLAIDYRLMPENSRMAGIEDCRTAYVWLAENGPDGSSDAETLVVVGDSSGGNLALSTIAWARDAGQRTADAVVVLSPQTDATLASPSLRGNIDTDVMQGGSFGPIVKAPRVFSLWFMFLTHRISPSNPLMSPLLGDLSNLPPTLLQVSAAEMFLDDSVRYANKATAQGSPTELQIWPFVMHVWHAFQVPEADEAFQEIEKFLGRHAAR